MDKRFFLALFLSLIVIVVSQLLFPPPKPAPRSAAPRDSSGTSRGAASSTQPAVISVPATVSSKPRVITTVPVLRPRQTRQPQRLRRLAHRRRFTDLAILVQH